MPGIRERKKARTRREILRCALDLFTRDGFDATTMEEIGNAALVGVGTLYNYFGSKGDILIAVVAQRTEQILEETAALVPGPHPDACRAVTDLLVAYVSGLGAFEPGLLRETLSQAIAHPGGFGQRMLELDARLMAQLSELVVRLQTAGSVAPDLDPSQASFVLYAQAMTHLILWAQVGVPSPAAMNDELETMVRALFRDWHAHPPRET